jgi:hypothetical protein
MARVPVQYEDVLYLPDWLIRKRASERVKVLMQMVKPRDGSVETEDVKALGPNDKVPGIVKVAPKGNERRDFLFIPSMGMLSRDHVLDIIGMVKKGGYGKPPEHESESISKQDWHRTVRNWQDKKIETIKQRQGNKVKFAV